MRDKNLQHLPPHQYYRKNSVGFEVCTYDAETLREQKLCAIDDWEKTMKQTPIEYLGHFFHFNTESYQKVMGQVMLGSGSITGTWTDINKVDIPADCDFMSGLFGAMNERMGMIHSTQRKMKNDLLALTDPAEIAAYEVPTCL